MKPAPAEYRTRRILALCYIIFTIVLLVCCVGCDHIDVYRDHGENLGAIPSAIYRVIMCIGYPYMMLTSILLFISILPLLPLGFFLPEYFGNLLFFIPSCVISVLAAVYLFRGAFQWRKVPIFLCHIAHAWMIYHYGFPILMSV